MYIIVCQWSFVKLYIDNREVYNNCELLLNSPCCVCGADIFVSVQLIELSEWIGNLHLAYTFTKWSESRLYK